MDANTCHAARKTQTVQPFPKNGLLHDNLRLTLPSLEKQIGKEAGKVYSYVLSTVKLNNEKTKFEQHGSAPNFQGGLLTLCTCKHQMRATRSTDDWQGVWLAGFSSRTICDGKHWLFYLMKVGRVFESHSELWGKMSAEVQQAKAANKHFLGDMFEPKKPNLVGADQYEPSRYFAPPVHAHRQHPNSTAWHNDIAYHHAARYKRQPPLLVGDPEWTFLWDKPIVHLTKEHYRNYSKWGVLEELVAKLKGPN